MIPGSVVRLQSAQVAAMAADWELVDALMGGTGTMRAAGRKYLPKWPSEDEASYGMRLGTATLFPAYARTVSVMVGKPFSKPITIGEDIPPRIAALLDDVDLQGQNLHTMAADVFRECLAYGLAGILVDCPPANGALSVADEKAAGIRPYMVRVHAKNILGWKVAFHNGKQKLQQLRLLESVEEDSGPFATRAVEQVRVLEPGAWALFRKIVVNGVETWALHEEGSTSLPEIPFVPFYGLRRTFMIGTPPMLDLGHANVEHWQSKSDQQTILHVARVPLLFAKGKGPDDQITVGVNSLVSFGGDNADLKYVEHSGKAIEAGRASLLDLEDRMRQIGAELLVIKSGDATEVQTIADNEIGMCDLQRITQSVETGLDAALDFMAQWVGEKQGGHVTIYRDFGAATLAEASSNLLFEMKSVGALSHETLLSELKRRGIISPDIDIAKEIARAKAEAPPVAVTENVAP